MQHELREDRLSAVSVLGFLAETLRDLAQRIEVVEAHVAGSLDPLARHDRVRMMALQDIDLIRQMAEDAARVAENARENGGGQRAELAAGLRLSLLRARLASAGRGGDSPATAGDADDNGHVELFKTGGGRQ